MKNGANEMNFVTKKKKKEMVSYGRGCRHIIYKQREGERKT